MVQKVLISSINLIILFSSHIYSQIPDTVWVDDEYSATTTGWGTTHFAVIQDGIDAVAKAGTVNVAAGTWNENIEIQNGKSLIGTGIGQSFINSDGNKAAISVRDTGSVIKYFTVNTAGEDWSDFPIKLVDAHNVTVQNNHILESGIELGGSHNNTISNNLIEGKGSIFISDSWNNRIENNELRSVLYPGQIWVLGNSCNNIIADNTIIGNANDASCTGIRSMMSSNNLYKKQV